MADDLAFCFAGHGWVLSITHVGGSSQSCSCDTASVGATVAEQQYGLARVSDTERMLRGLVE